MKKEIITPGTVAKPAAPYASVVKVTAPGSLVFVSGVVSSENFKSEKKKSRRIKPILSGGW